MFTVEECRKIAAEIRGVKPEEMKQFGFGVICGFQDIKEEKPYILINSETGEEFHFKF